MAEYPNFFETQKEADMRLQNTIVLYDKEPYYVLCCAEHPDGIMRIYLDPLGDERGLNIQRLSSIPHNTPNEKAAGGKDRYERMDAFMEKYKKDCTIVRKYMNSPHFNKFRPFPLGMCNYGDTVYYLERNPIRRGEQGLTQNMISGIRVGLGKGGLGGGCPVQTTSSYMKDCIVGKYPSAKECYEAVVDPDCENTEAAFSRDFAFVSGPMETVYLNYRGDTVGVLHDMNNVRLSKKFVYVKEAVSDLRLFNNITI
jgi:hypothetical protein